MNPPHTYASGFHDSGNWTEKSDLVYYYPGCLLHSWAAGANISKAALSPPDGPNRIDTQNAWSGQDDWKAVDNCVQFLNSYRDGDPPFFLYCSVINPHPPYTSNATWEAFIDRTQLDQSLARTERTYTPLDLEHPADTYGRKAE